MASISDIVNIAMTIVAYFFIIAMIDWWVTSKKIWNIARELTVTYAYLALVVGIPLYLGQGVVYWEVALAWLLYCVFAIFCLGPDFFDNGDRYRFSRY